MGRCPVVTLAPLLLLLLLLLSVRACSARTRPYTEAAIVFPDDRFGYNWDRFRMHARTAASSGTAFEERAEELGPTYLALQASPPDVHARLELPPRESHLSPEANSALEPAADPALRTAPSSAIIFPDQPGYQLTAPFARDRTSEQRPVTAENELEMPICDGVSFRALDADSGQCRSLTMRSGCEAGHWFVMDRQTRVAACRPHPCPLGFAMYRGRCQNLTDVSVCGEQMVLQVDEFGDASCDCARSGVFWSAQQRCYPAMLRGPCAEGEQLVANASGALCAPNPCGRDGWALWPETGACHPLRDPTHAPCDHGRMDVDPTSLQLVCNNAVANSVFATPSIRCAVGSRRAQAGRCKRQLQSKSTLRLSDGGTRCPAGFVETPDGGCRNKAAGSLGGLG